MSDERKRKSSMYVSESKDKWEAVKKPGAVAQTAPSPQALPPMPPMPPAPAPAPPPATPPASHGLPPQPPMEKPRPRKGTTPIFNGDEPPPRLTVPVEKSNLIAQQESHIKVMMAKLEKAASQINSLNAFNEELVAANIGLKTHTEELEIQVKTINERAMTLAATISKKTTGWQNAEKLAKAATNLAETFYESDPKKVVQLLGNACPKLLEALIDTVSLVKP